MSYKQWLNRNRNIYALWSSGFSRQTDSGMAGEILCGLWGFASMLI